MAYWRSQQDDKTTTQIKPHNQYFRDFMANNPTLGVEDARKIWALKKKLPSEAGHHEYEPGDLKLRDDAKPLEPGNKMRILLNRQKTS